MDNIITRRLRSPDSLNIRGIPVIYIINEGTTNITIGRHTFNIKEESYVFNDKYAVYPTRYKLSHNVCVIDCTHDISVHTIDKSYRLSDIIDDLDVFIEQVTGACLIKYDSISFNYFNNLTRILGKQHQCILDIKNTPDTRYLQSRYTINELKKLHTKLREHVDSNYIISLNYDKTNINKISPIDPLQRISEHHLIKLQQAIAAKNNYLTSISLNYNNKSRLIDKCGTLITKYNNLATSYNNTHTQDEVNTMIKCLYNNSSDLSLLKNKLTAVISNRRQLYMKILHINRLAKEINLITK